MSRIPPAMGLLLGSLSIIATSSTVAVAQTQGGTGLEEIVVTAQKRAENMQSVPIAVTAMTGDAVDKLHATSMLALQGTVPSVQIDHFSNSPNSAVFSIRGIGVIEPDPYAGNTVSIVVDGVPQFFSIGALLDLYDISRIEILRGPQGTLFGANTTGGVVNVVTEQPTGEFGGKAEVTLGNYDRIDASATVDFPIVEDVLAGKVAVAHFGRDGYHTNVVDGQDMGSRDVTILRGYLKLTPGDNFDATLIAEYDRARNGAPIFINASVPGEILYVPPGPVPGAALPMYPSPCIPAGQPCHMEGDYYSARDSVPDISNMDTYRATLTMNWTDTAVGDVTAITGYRDFKVLEFTDQDGTPLFFADTRRRTEGWQLSQELRTSVDLHDSVNVILGGFYMKTHYDHRQDYRLQWATPGLVQLNLQEQDNWSGSLFAQSYVDVTDRLRLQAGVRYTHEKTEMLASTRNTLNPSGMTNHDGTGNIFISEVAPPKGSESWDKLGWKLGLDYQLTDDVLTYGYWARGFKSGGFTGRIGVEQDLGPYDPEEVDTFEVGIKGDLLDRRLRLNLAGFLTKYRDMQLASIYFTEDAAGTVVQGNSIINAARAEIKGFEVEAMALPMEGLTLRGSLSYLDAKYKKFDFWDANTTGGGVPQLRDLTGYRLQNAPKWSATAGATYEFALGEGLMTADVHYSYVSAKFFTAINNTPRARIQPTHLVHANLEWTPDHDRWSIGLWARNLFDERYMASIFDVPGLEGLGSHMPPREYGVTFKTRW